MASTAQFTIRINKDLKMEAQKKANKEFGLGLGTLTKIFLKYFVSAKDSSRIAFYLGNADFDKKLDEMVKSEKVKSALKNLGNAI